MRPNILLITTDTQRWDTLGCMGASYAISPCLDQLAKEGVLFEQAHTSCPVCSPARTCLLTGLHTPVHGRIENGIEETIRPDYEVYPDLLKKQGYTNIIVAKTHFGRVPSSFDVQRITSGEKSSNADDFYAEHIRKHGFERKSQHPNPIPEELFIDSFLADTAIEEIDRVVKNGQGPFFAHCSLISPHPPFDPPGKWAKLYEQKELPPINYVPGEIDDFPFHLKRLLGLEGHEAEIDEWLQSPEGMKQIDLQRRLYYGLAAYCDAQVGKIVDYLNQSGLRKDTLVIFTSDHGTQLYDHGFEDKHNYYDATWRVPLIMSMPGTLPVNEKRDFAIWNDITASILGAAGIQSQFVQGFDLFTPLSKGMPSPRRCAVGSLYKSVAVVTEKWKLEYYLEEGVGRLFDRQNDSLERIDLYSDKAYENIRNQLVTALLTWRSSLSDVEYLVKKTGGGGPVARRIAVHTKAMRGVDAEERLNKMVEELDGTK